MIDLLLKLFNLHSSDFESASNWHVRFVSEWQPIIVILAAIGLAILVWQVYRREHGSASAGMKWLLGLLRLIAFAVLIVAILEPQVVLGRVESKDAFVLVLGDGSDSMKLTDGYNDEDRLAKIAYAMGLMPEAVPPVPSDVAKTIRSMSRADILNRILDHSGIINRISQDQRVRQYTFATALSPASLAEDSTAPAGAVQPLRITPDGPATQTGDCMREAVVENRGQRIAAMIIFSDWGWNNGISPLEAAKYAQDAKSQFPIITVGVGDPAEQKDIIVSNLASNPIALVNNDLQFDVTIEQTGFNNQEVVLQLLVNGQVVNTQKVTLTPETKHVKISHKPDKMGEFTYKVVVPVQEGELSPANNSREQIVTVKDDKLRVLLISGQPTWEWRYLKNALARDTTVEVSSWLQSAESGWVMANGKQLSQLPANRSELVDQFDVIIMLGAAPEALSTEQMENIRAFVRDASGGLIFEAGSNVVNNQFRNTPIQDCLPVWLDASDAGVTEWKPYKPSVTDTGWRSAQMQLAADPQQNRDVWAHLPNLFWTCPVGKTKPGAFVLAEHPDERNEEGPKPIIVEQNYGGRVMFLATDETWRWRFRMGDTYFYRFWRQSLAVAAADKILGNSKRLTLSVSRNQYAVGQKVEIEAKYRDERDIPPETRTLATTILLPDGGKRQLQLTPADSSRKVYRGSFIARDAGMYRATIPSPGGTTESTPFQVTISTLESETRRLNVKLGQEVAAKTLGQWFFVEDISQIPDIIKSESANITTEQTVTVWDSWGMLVLFAVPLSIEWFLRKRRQMV